MCVKKKKSMTLHSYQLERLGEVQICAAEGSNEHLSMARKMES